MRDDYFLENLLNLFRIEQREDEFYYHYSNDAKITEIDKTKNVFNDFENIREKELTIYYKNEDKKVAEVALAHESYLYRRDEEGGVFKKVKDNDNQIEYEVSVNVSDTYIVWFYKQMFEEYPMQDKSQEMFRLRQFFRRRANMIFRIDPNKKQYSLLDVMRNAADFYTLKVTKENESRINLDEAINSFSYTYMCNMNSPLKVYSIEDIIGISSSKKKEANTSFEAPKRKYNSDLLDYYNLAVSSEDPYISFISYYHIIEYFFDQVYREQQIKTLRDSITDPRFSNKDDDKVFNIIEKILKDGRAVREDGSGNELPSLIYLLNKYISDLDDYKERLNDKDLNFYQNNKVSFSQGDVIIWDKPKDKILKAISHRIYKTRNALIHSKSSKKDVTYHPYSHKTELEKEISLIKALAEHIIEGDSELLV